MTGRLQGKVAFIAGATSGIGERTAEIFAREGARVALAGRRAELGEAIAAGIRASGGEAMAIALDVRDAAAVRAALDSVVDRYGKLDVVFNNAGGSSARDGRVTEAPEDELRRVLELDLLGTWNCARFGIPHMVAAGGGSLINMTSMVAVSPVTGRDAYTAAKGAVAALTRSMAREYVGERIRVNALAPAAVATDRIKGLLESVPGARQIVARQQLGLISTDEVAYAAVFLAADESRTMTGQILAIHGGTFEG